MGLGIQVENFSSNKYVYEKLRKTLLTFAVFRENTCMCVMRVIALLYPEEHLT